MSKNHLLLLDNVIKEQKKEIYPDDNDANFFEYFVAKEILKNEDLSFEEIESCLTGGTRDGGIDSFIMFIDDRLVLDVEEEIHIAKGATFKLYLIQTSRTDGFKEDALIKLQDSSKKLFDLTEEIQKLSNLYNENIIEKFELFHSLYKDNAVKFPKLEIRYHYATRSTEAPHPTVSTRADELIRDLKREFVNCEVFFNFLGATELWELANESPSKVFKLNIISAMSTTGKDTICFVELNEYKNFITNETGDLRKNIFESNVRDYQGTVEVNKNIEETLRSGPSEENFWWLNNGITIICSNFRSTGNELTIEDPQIVNGLQTSNQIFSYFKENPNTSEQKNNASNQRHVLVRIIKPENESSRDKIIKATNSQTAIPPGQLRATDKIHRDIEKFFEVNGIFYDRRKNFYRNAGKQRSLIIGIPGLAQAISAIFLQKPHDSRAKPSSLIKAPARYEEIFNEAYDLKLYLNIAKFIMAIEKFMKSDSARDFSKDLKYHLAMFAVAKKLNKAKPIEADFKNLENVQLENNFLLDCLNQVNIAIIALKKDDLTSVNKIVKSLESVDAILNLLRENLIK